MRLAEPQKVLEAANSILEANGFHRDQCPVRGCEAKILVTSGFVGCTNDHSPRDIALAISAEQDVELSEIAERAGDELDEDDAVHAAYGQQLPA